MHGRLGDQEAGVVSVEHVQTKREIQAILASAGMRPRKRFGQHFLIDGNLMRRLVDAADLSRDDLAIEVGAGTGGLTDLLVAHAGRVVSVEIDTTLQLVLADRFRNQPRFRLIAADALTSKHRLADELANEIDAFDHPTGCVKLVANLPYQVATPLVMNLLVDFPKVRRFVFTVQAEVGDRVSTGPGSKAYGPLSIVAGLLADVSTIARLPPEVFWPRPAVDSVMLQLDLKPVPFCDRSTLRRFVSFVRGVFEHRRKTLRAAVGLLTDAATRDRVCESVDATRRPESFTRDEWLALFSRFDEPKPFGNATQGEPVV